MSIKGACVLMGSLAARRQLYRYKQGRSLLVCLQQHDFNPAAADAGRGNMALCPRLLWDGSPAAQVQE